MKKLNLDGYNQISIEKVVSSLGVSHVSVIRPYKVQKSIEAIKEALDVKGVSVIISRQMCTLYAKSLKKLKALPFYISDKCKNHRTCVNELACPAFYIQDERVKIDPVMCVGCAVCAQICPEKAIFTDRKVKTQNIIDSQPKLSDAAQALNSLNLQPFSFTLSVQEISQCPNLFN